MFVFVQAVMHGLDKTPSVSHKYQFPYVAVLTYQFVVLFFNPQEVFYGIS